MENIEVPKPQQDRTPDPVHHLRTATAAFTLAASALALAAQVLEHFRKPKAGPDQRTKAGTALLALAVLRTMPGLIKSAKRLAADLRGTGK